MEELEDCPDRSVRRHVGARGRLVYRVLLHPDLLGQVSQGRSRNDQLADDGRNSRQRGFLCRVWCPVRQGWAQACDAVWHDLDAGGLFPRFPHAHSDGQSGLG